MAVAAALAAEVAAVAVSVVAILLACGWMGYRGQERL